MTENPYLDRITSQHRQRPKFVAVVDVVTRPVVELQAPFEPEGGAYAAHGHGHHQAHHDHGHGHDHAHHP